MTKLIAPSTQIKLTPESYFHIDRSVAFDPNTFMTLNPVQLTGNISAKEGWIIEQEDERSLQLSEIRGPQIQFKQMVKARDGFVPSEKILDHLKRSRLIPLDAMFLQTFWNNINDLPEGLKKINPFNGKTPVIHFDGTILKHACGYRCVLSLGWYYGRWAWGHVCLLNKRGSGDLSSVLLV